MSSESKLARIVTRHSGVVLALFGLLAALAIVPASRVRIDTSLENLMLADDPDRDRNLEIKHQFSNDEIIVVALELGRPFGAADLHTLNRLSNRLLEIDGVEEVLDLSTIEDVRADGDTLDASALVDMETVASDIGSIRSRVQGHRLYDSLLVSGPGDVLALVVVLELRDQAAALNFRVTEAVLEALAQEVPQLPTWVSGYPASEYEGFRLITRDLATLTSAALLIVLALIWLVFRSVAVVSLTLALITWSELSALAWFGLTDTPITMITALLPAVLVATSAGYAVYFFSMFAHASEAENPAVKILESIARPTMISGGSTAIGFLSLLVTPVDVVGDLGVGLAFGIAASTLGALLLLPAAIHRAGLRGIYARFPAFSGLTQLGVRFARYPARVLSAAFVFAALMAMGLMRLEVDSDPTQYYGPKTYHRQSDEFIRKHLAGTLPVNVIISGKGDGGAFQPELLAFADKMVERLESEPIVDRTVSFLDYLALMDNALTNGRYERTVPESAATAAQYTLLYEVGGDPADYRHYIDHNRTALNIYARVNTRSSSAVLGMSERIRAFAESAPPSVQVEVLGNFLLFEKAMDGINRSIIGGLLLSMVLISVVMIVALHSVRLGLIALIPNALPLLFATGMMGWLGIPLSFGTSIVGCLALGLAVDDTAHILGHLGPRTTLNQVYSEVGSALALTTVVLSVGFGVTILAEFRPVADLGIATALTLVVALLCDLLVLPSFLAMLGVPLSTEMP